MSRWVDYENALVAAGLPAEDAKREADSDRETYLSLVSGRCPKCDEQTIKKERSGRQAGPSRVDGAWFEFKCSACKYTCSWVVPEGVSA